MNVADGRGPKRQLSEINVTPFVDVMLVLLIIFMVTAPLMQQGIDVDLPKTQSQGLRSENQPLVVTVKRGTVAKTLAILRGAGASSIGMVTEPEA
jgi:biopolymer transport protein ExbD